MAVAAVAELTPTVAVTTLMAEALVVPVAAEMAAVLAMAVAPISTARRELQTLAAAVEEQILNQLSLAMADQESSLFVMHCQLHRLFRRPRQLLALHARAQR